MSAPKRYVVEVRPPKAAERYLDDYGNVHVCRTLYDHPDARPVIVEELTPPPHPLAGTYFLIGFGKSIIHGYAAPHDRGDATHTLVIADDGTCTLTDIEATS